MTILEIKKSETITNNGRSKTILVLKCDWCEKTFEDSTRNVVRKRKQTTHFCTNRCAGKYKMTNNPNTQIGLLNFSKHHEKMKNDVEYATKVNEKTKNTCLEKYDCERPLQSPAIREKTKQTLIERYNVDNPTKSPEILEKTKNTCLEKYGCEYQISSEHTRNKIEAVLMEKYGAISPAKKVRKILETNEYAIDWLKRQSEPKPRAKQIERYFPSHIEKEAELIKFLDDWRNNKTGIESVLESLFQTNFYNKKPENLLSKKSYKPDFRLSENIFVNADGFFWHSEEKKGRQYHFKLRNDFEQSNLRIFQFLEHEIIHKRNIVSSIVNHALGKTINKIYARKCEIRKIPQGMADMFLNENHIMGTIKAKHIGLFYNEKLVSIFSYKEKNKTCNIDRYCSLNNHNVIGAFSKLLSFLIKTCIKADTNQIHNWVDLRYGTGKHLLSKGFFESRTSLGWCWCDGEMIYNRLKCRANMDDRKLSEKEYAKELGWYKIYDAGQRLYILNV